MNKNELIISLKRKYKENIKFKNSDNKNKQIILIKSKEGNLWKIAEFSNKNNYIVTTDILTNYKLEELSLKQIKDLIDTQQKFTDTLLYDLERK